MQQSAPLRLNTLAQREVTNFASANGRPSMQSHVVKAYDFLKRRFLAQRDSCRQAKKAYITMSAASVGISAEL